MSVSTIVKLFRQELLSVYPKGEVESFISLAFEEVLAYDKVDIFMKGDDSVPEQFAGRFFGILEGLKQKKPIQYLLGKTVFYGLPIRLSPHVLIPRPETEELVHWILQEEYPPRISVLDLGTGSGCIAIALKSNLKQAEVYGVDNSVSALNMAAFNAKENNLNISFFQFDILEQESLGFMKFDLMVSNPPYVRTTEKTQMDSNVLDHEPDSALFVTDEEPLVFYRRIVDLASGHLNKNGRLYFEINEAFGREVAQLLRDHGFTDVEIRKDFNGKDRMVGGIRS